MGKPAFESGYGDDDDVVVVDDDDDDNDVVVFANLKLDFCDLRCSLALGHFNSDQLHGVQQY